MLVPAIKQGADPEFGYFDGQATFVIFKDGTLARTFNSPSRIHGITEFGSNEISDPTGLNPGYDYIIDNPESTTLSLGSNEVVSPKQEKLRFFFGIFNLISFLIFLTAWTYTYSKNIDLFTDPLDFGIPGNSELLIAPMLWIMPDLLIAHFFGKAPLPEISIVHRKFPQPRVIGCTGWYLEKQLNVIIPPKIYLFLSVLFVSDFFYASIALMLMAAHRLLLWTIFVTEINFSKGQFVEVEGVEFSRFAQELNNRLAYFAKPHKESISELVSMDEGQHLEFKSSIWSSYRDDSGEQVVGAEKNENTEGSVIKTIAAFMNTEGGQLIIGVQDRPVRRVVGIEADFEYSGKQKDIEDFQNSLSDLIRSSTNEDSIVGTYVNIRIEKIQEKSICIVDVKKRQPKSWTWVDLKKWKDGNPLNQAFFIRSGPQTKLLKSQDSAHEWRTSSEELRADWVFPDE